MPLRVRLITILAVLLVVASAGDGRGSESVVSKPPAVISGIPFTLELSSPADEPVDYAVEIVQSDRSIFTHTGALPDRIEGITIPASGRARITVTTAGETWTTTARVLPAFVSLLPPLLAILAALIFRQVVIALFGGIWLGALFVNDYNLFSSLFYVVDHYVIDAFAGSSGRDHVAIAIFTLLLGGMVGVFSRIGGTQGAVNEISRIATTPRRGQLATWLMGVAVFFDDYTNTLIVGNTMRPITDRLRISREKLSYIVDSTAAPVACIAVITSWVGFEVSLVKDAFGTAGIDRNPFTTFVASLQYSFYPILALFFGLLVAATARDFGPMLSAERRARHSGRLLSDNAVPLSTVDRETVYSDPPNPRWFNAAIPIAVVVFGTFVGLLVTGRSSLVGSGVSDFSLLDAIRESNSFDALVWSSLAGCLTAITLGLVQRLASLTSIMDAWVAGLKSMLPAIVILVLAWCIGSVCADLRTADVLVAKVSGFVRPHLLATTVFVIAAAISFATGTSWGTMTILTPITIPLVARVGELHEMTGSGFESLLLSSIAAILAGSVWGDHCSPISDTTIMSSMASGADHIDHVRTQLPYASVVALIAVLFGYLPVGFGVPGIVSLLLGCGAVFGVIMLVGRPDHSHRKGATTRSS